MVVVDDTSTYICICILAFIHPQGCFMYLLLMLLDDLEQYIYTRGQHSNKVFITFITL